ncbi:beta and beta-prime subunits of DNA dependent RNA-polymerase [Aaosphaeria arxii CBS 175.79]|uniref:DNA-directed RNA polymerase subunit n=1 Tax=Aaosphaeria arxii CBS 175.79 TaxID=1450172 RepID=A0A6A5Y4Z5_9PLEO|nr:beta and beta-prime subunits of DNA dependent RNA-polymerase [Aaosphaeria arxii CBS 175.79]KAF2020283.1 beta and beta-prime subunits of DNA dependent RNA-polymerase [Aaosphaeria arxii CBS 175.79]
MEAKQQVVDKVPARIRQIQFGIFSNQDIVNQAVLEVSDRNVYDLTNANEAVRTHTAHGPMDAHMGISSKTGRCETCGEGLDTCNGHFGHIKLALPAFHVGYLKQIIEVLHCICKECSRVLLDHDERRRSLRTMRRAGKDNLLRVGIARKIMEECRKKKRCPHCDAVNGTIRKVAGHPLKIIHNKYDAFNRSTAKTKKPPPGKVEFDQSFAATKATNPEVDKHMKKAVDDMHPLRVLYLFKKIAPEDCELLCMIPDDARPEMLIWEYVPVPPVAIRPSVMQEAGATEDDITNKIGDIVHVSGIIRAGLQRGFPLQVLMEQWDFLQLQIAMYINSEVPGLKQQGLNTKTMRGFCQRLKGKGGRFRQNLSGKRVDFSGRTVIGPDPNLSIEEVAVPERVAKNLTYPEKATRYNLEKLKKLIRNGAFRYPGANFIIKPKTNTKITLQGLSRAADSQNKLDKQANFLQIGDIVERHIEDGDVVLFNRQPSLHKLSILSHRAKVRPWRTFRLNECVCNPYNADFDGDEMNLHVPQTEEARTEAIELMGVKNNLATPKNGTPLIAAIQDFITAAYQLSSKNNFFDRRTFCQIVNYMFNGDGAYDPDTGKTLPVEIPPPTIWKPQALWTGKQVFNLLMRPNKQSKVLVNLEAAAKQFKPTPGQAHDLSMDDAYLVIRNSEVMCGVMDKATVGDGKKDSVFYVLMRDFGPDYAVQGMNRLAKLSARWLTNNGFSIGISDVTPGQMLERKKEALIQEAYAKCDQLIEDFENGRLQRDPGCDEEKTMENRIGGILSGVRQAAGDICFDELSRWNAPLLMAKCGSKGSNINVSQMVASVGQQMIGGARVADGFHHRTLPHFPKSSRQPASKGFVKNSFFSGLLPYEFIFHAMSGREGLVDTAVKTAETGYMSRRLMKSLEDLSAQYDDTVRNSSGTIVQFLYGDDNLDPVDMEGKAKPVNFDRTFSHAVTSTWNNEEPSLAPEEIKSHTLAKLNAERNKYHRYKLDGVTRLPYNDKSDDSIDQKESIRDFLDTVQDYINKKANTLQTTLDHLGIMQPKRGGPEDADKFTLADGIAKISQSALDTFITLCLTKYDRSRVQPGHAVGAIGAQSIGEPGTQMTLKTFHFAGVAGMSITQGVPRIKEIINASSNISTPVIACELSNKIDDKAARVVKARVEKTFLRDIVKYVEDVWHPSGAYVALQVDWDVVNSLFVEVSMQEIANAIQTYKPLKWGKGGTGIRFSNSILRVEVADPSASTKRSTAKTTRNQKEYFERVQQVKNLILEVVIKGYADCQRAIIKKNTTPNDQGHYECQLLVEGYGLKDCLTTPGIEPYKTRSNHVMEVKKVLGIEAARSTIIAEIGSVMGSMDIDPRHMQLLADVMTFKGEVFGITRFGLQKTRDSVLQLASFEKTPDHLFEAASKGKVDHIDGVSECIIMGQSVKLGTGAMQVVRRLNLDDEDLAPKRTMFEDGWDAL